MKRFSLAAVALHLFSSLVFAEDLAVDLRFEPNQTGQTSSTAGSTVKSLRPVRIQAFTDTRAGVDTLLGELKVNGSSRKVQSKTAVSVYATDAFRKIYDEWGGPASPDAQLVLAGEITQFSLEETDGYQAKVGFRFLLKDGEGKVLWDGHSSGVVRGVGRTLTAETLPQLFNGLLRQTYTELLEDEYLIGIWSGRIQNTFIIRDAPAVPPAAKREG